MENNKINISFIATNRRIDELIERVIELEKGLNRLDIDLDYIKNKIGGI